jgi:hypothetical protein
MAISSPDTREVFERFEIRRQISMLHYPLLQDFDGIDLRPHRVPNHAI